MSDHRPNWRNCADCQRTNTSLTSLRREYVHATQLSFGRRKIYSPRALSILLCLWFHLSSLRFSDSCDQFNSSLVQKQLLHEVVGCCFQWFADLSHTDKVWTCIYCLCGTKVLFITLVVEIITQPATGSHDSLQEV